MTLLRVYNLYKSRCVRCPPARAPGADGYEAFSAQGALKDCRKLTPFCSVLVVVVHLASGVPDFDNWPDLSLHRLSMSSTASSLASATSGAVSASASATQGGSQPASYKVIGVLLAVGSGLVIGASFILKKKGLLNATKKAGGIAGEGHPYLKSVLVRGNGISV